VKIRLLSAIAILFSLNACSYGHGVYRILSFEDDITDFSCISAALKDMGYETNWGSQNWVAYRSDNVGLSANFGYSKFQKGDDLEMQKNKITHSVNFGSPPASCSSVKSAAELISRIEIKVLAACNLEPINTEEKIHCKN